MTSNKETLYPTSGIGKVNFLRFIFLFHKLLCFYIFNIDYCLLLRHFQAETILSPSDLNLGDFFATVAYSGFTHSSE